MKTKPTRHSILAVLFSLFATGQLHAAGFALIENSASGQGNAFAGAAATASDASTIWFNPAGMMRLDSDQLVAVGHLIVPKSDFNNGNTVDGLGNAVSGPEDDGGFNAIVPNLYYVYTINPDTRFGFGLTVPFGLATKYDDSWVGRYHTVETDLRTINLNPSIAYRVNSQLSVGGGISILFADVTLTSVVDFGALIGLPQGADGFADLEADNFGDPALGFNFSLLYELDKATRIGVAYRSEITIDVDGAADFSVPSIAAVIPTTNNVFVDTTIHGSIDLPQSLSVSVAHEMDKWTLLGDITWTGWSSFPELRIIYDNPAQPASVTTESWDDSFRYSIGADFQYSDDMILRGGIAYDETPVPGATRRTPRVPGNSRRWLSFGLSYMIDSAFTVDVGYSHLFISDAAINNTFESSQPALNGVINGSYEASVDIISAQVRWNY